MLRSALALVLLLSWASPVAAQPGEAAVRFQYTAPGSCPDAGSFTARVRQRTARGRLAQAGELARTFTVEVTAISDGFVGEIEFLDDGGVTVNRRLRGEQCDAVVSSLALITALALDATLREEEPDVPIASDAPPAPAASEAPSRTDEQTPVVVAPAPPAKRVAVDASPAPARTSSLLHARVGFAGGLTTVLDSPRGDASSVRVGLLGQLEWRSAFALRLSAHLDTVGTFEVDDGRRARLRILGVETSFCPWRLRSAGFGFYPCGVVDLGSLRAEGELGDKLTTAGGKTVLWASAGVEARLLYDVATLPIWLEVSASTGFPLVATRRFQFLSPTAVVYEVPRYTTAVGAAAGVRFW